ncbi:MAG: PepSY domain-containing protein [Maritimibacter harenae]
MKRFASMTAIALLATTPAVTALAQDDARAELNQEVYAEGMAELTGDGYDVETVRQDDEGSLTFMARNETNGRILIMDDDGDVVSDTMTDLNASTRIEFEGEGEGEDDDDGEASVMVGADTGIDVEADGENDGTDDESSASVNIGSDTSIGIEADGDDGDDSASLGIDAGVDLGISADSDS